MEQQLELLNRYKSQLSESDYYTLTSHIESGWYDSESTVANLLEEQYGVNVDMSNRPKVNDLGQYKRIVRGKAIDIIRNIEKQRDYAKCATETIAYDQEIAVIKKYFL